MTRPEPVFLQPWHAQVFALTVHLNESGVFDWPDWAAQFGATLARHGLERDLDVVLFRKSPQGYALTEAGLHLRDRAKAAEAAMRAATEGIAGAGGGEGASRVAARVQFGQGP